MFTRLNALFLSAYFDYAKPIFMAIWFACWMTLWFFTAPQESFLITVGESFAYALFVSLAAFLLIIPIIFAVSAALILLKAVIVKPAIRK